MYLEDYHFNAAKLPNTASIEARNPWANGLIAIEESHIQAAKMLQSLYQ
jgi:hypothetical protein